MGGIVSQRRESPLSHPFGQESGIHMEYTIHKYDSNRIPPLFPTQSLLISKSLCGKLNRLPVSDTIEDLFLNVDVICMFYNKEISENDAEASFSLRHIHLVEHMVTHS